MNSGYQEAIERVAWDERLDRGRVLVTGPDARSFLHALLTNDISGLAPGRGAYAALLTPQGRMVTDAEVLVSPPQEGWGRPAPAAVLVVPASLAAPFASKLENSLFSEDASVTNISAALAHFSVTGPDAGRVVDDLIWELGGDPVAASLAWPYANASVDSGLGPALVWRSRELDLDGFDVLVPANHASAARTWLAANVAPLTPPARMILRVEAGRPEFLVDMTADTIPLEANLLDRAISTTKGCYVGQEVIIRVLHRGGGRVAKRLMRLTFDGGEDAVPVAGEPLTADDRDVGRVTSAVWSPRASAAIGLGYVHRDFAEVGETLALADGRVATITGE